jgi:hypothetical protein
MQLVPHSKAAMPQAPRGMGIDASAAESRSQMQNDIFLNKVFTNTDKIYYYYTYKVANHPHFPPTSLQLTDKLAVHIREEVKKEMRTSFYTPDLREAVAGKMESYLEAELGTHTCQYEYAS